MSKLRTLAQFLRWWLPRLVKGRAPKSINCIGCRYKIPPSVLGDDFKNPQDEIRRFRTVKKLRKELAEMETVKS